LRTCSKETRRSERDEEGRRKRLRMESFKSEGKTREEGESGKKEREGAKRKGAANVPFITSL
jgi:hypothetical protein